MFGISRFRGNSGRFLEGSGKFPGASGRFLETLTKFRKLSRGFLPASRTGRVFWGRLKGCPRAMVQREAAPGAEVTLQVVFVFDEFMKS